MTEREDRLALADKIEGAFGFVGFETEKRKFMHRPVEISEEEQATIVAALRLSPVMDGMREALDDDHMQKISALIARLQSTMDQFGDTCVYIRRGGLSWGAVALNRRDDDKRHGVFDLQAQHDRDMFQRAEQVERLIASKNEWMERAAKAKAALSAPHPQARGEDELERLREWKSSILGICKTCDGFDSLKWGGDKEGWGFVFYFIQHLNTRALHAETVLAEQDAARPLEATALDRANYKIGWWLSGALDDPAVCAEMKADINAWFEAHQAGLKLFSPAPESLHASRNGADIDGPNTKPQSPVGHYTGRPIT